MDRLKENGRAILGAGSLIAAVVFLIVGYTSIRDEVYVAIQLPDVLWSGVGAVLLAVVGVALLRSADERTIVRRLAELDDTNHELAEHVAYLTQLLELAILPGEADVPAGVAPTPTAPEADSLPAGAH
ncbi:MAG TPA: hypothetical protein VGJ14_11455 [Sporichthyaceae bacterium]|jgi:hypothetical protein